MNILTFDIEEWFHILDNDSTRTVTEWGRYESRIHRNMEIIYEIINGNNVSATFFVVGWIAERYPEVVKKISDFGFEIGSHTHMHQLAYEQNKKEFFKDVEKSIKTIEDSVGRKVRSFRAPGFSITKKNIWAFEILHELGIEIDSSVFPAHRSHGGLPIYTRAYPSLLNYNGITLKEFPINTHSFYGKNMVFSGGGYFRVMPYNFIKSCTERSEYVMTYFHPRDFDADQPLLPGLSFARHFKSYVGLKKCRSKLEKWLTEFTFIDIAEAEKIIRWDEVPKVFL